MIRTKTVHHLLDQDAHRPWPIPKGRPWAMRMSWHRLLFAHWSLDPAVLRPIVPASLDLDLFGHRAWIGIVPFEMRRVKPRFFPGVPGHTRFLELNVRSYVRHGDLSGVYFFSLDAESVLAVETARRAFYLPYFNAQMSHEADHQHDDRVHYMSRRTDRRSPIEARFEINYNPIGERYRTRAGDLDHFLTERYCLFSVHPRDDERVYVGHIHHEPWTLRATEAMINTNTMTAPFGIDLEAQSVSGPICHVADPIDVVAWKLTRSELLPEFARGMPFQPKPIA